MHSVFNKEDYQSLVSRIESLSPGNPRQWGKMNIVQMLAHCSAALKISAGIVPAKKMFLGRIIGKFVKKLALSETPMRKNSPTDPTFIVMNTADFQKEKSILLDLMAKMYNECSQTCGNYPHSFFGKMSNDEWGVLIYKHIDHHLMQFGQ